MAGSYREEKRLCSSQGSMFDSNNQKIPRPMNAFMIFAAENRGRFKESYPEENNKDISVRLGEHWRHLPKAHRESFYEKARNEEKEHKKKYPNYVYCPGVARQRKRERLAEKARLDAILKAEIDSVLNENRSRQMGSNYQTVPPMPEFMNQTGSPGGIQDMDMFNFGQQYSQAGSARTPLFASPTRAGTGYNSPYRQGQSASATQRHNPYPQRERLLPISHFTQPLSQSQHRPFYSSSYGEVPQGATYPRQMPPLHRAPYPYPLRHSRPPYMVQGGPSGHYHHFDRAQPTGEGMLYRQWHPLSTGVFETVAIKPEEEEMSSHSFETASQADSVDETRHHCTTPSDTSQNARPDIYSQTRSVDNDVHTMLQIPIISSNPNGARGSSQTLEQTSNVDNSKQAALLSLSGPPYNFVVAHYPQAHFGTPDQRVQHMHGDTYSFSPSSELNISGGTTFGDLVTTTSDVHGVPQFYTMKCQQGEVNQEVMMSPIRFEQPFYTDRPTGESSPFSMPKHLPNEFIEQIAKQFYLLQGGEKLMSPTIVMSPSPIVMSPSQVRLRGEHQQSPSPSVAVTTDEEQPVPTHIDTGPEHDRKESVATKSEEEKFVDQTVEEPEGAPCSTDTKSPCPAAEHTILGEENVAVDISVKEDTENIGNEAVEISEKEDTENISNQAVDTSEKEDTENIVKSQTNTDREGCQIDLIHHHSDEEVPIALASNVTDDNIIDLTIEKGNPDSEMKVSDLLANVTGDIKTLDNDIAAKTISDDCGDGRHHRITRSSLRKRR